jgi:hypothetical protein
MQYRKSIQLFSGNYAHFRNPFVCFPQIPMKCSGGNLCRPDVQIFPYNTSLGRLPSVAGPMTLRSSIMSISRAARV